MLGNNFELKRFAILLSIINCIFFYFPFFRYVFEHIDYLSFNGILLIISMVIAVLLANFFLFHLLLSISRIFGKIIIVLSFFINAIAVYFINTYSVIIDESMIGNVLNTKYSEASSFLSIKLILYILFLAILPSLWIYRSKISGTSLKKFLKTSGITLLILVVIAFINASNWLWVDKNSKFLGGLAMPWSYSVNTSLFYIHESKKNQKETLLPNATIENQKKSIVVLVIGESARSQNFSLYGYNRNTNPLLSKIQNVTSFNANSCATYTTAGVKCILSHENTDELYEILPNYLHRNDVEVIWRTTNWGEPPVHIKNYLSGKDLQEKYKVSGEFDEVLLAGLKEQILSSTKNKILVVLHTSTSHGPTYSKKYPKKFEVFQPVCNSVELGNCTKEELINAYDNTIVYTDYLLNEIITQLDELKDYKSSMLFVSDHGESLGEKNLYMHGLPMSIAPKEQIEIPFIIWTSDGRKIKPLASATQNHVFHSVLKFLGISSPIYKEEFNIYE